MRMSDHPSVEVSTSIAAPPELVWALVSDVTRTGEWGAECVGARWVEPDCGPVVGARFVAQQLREGREWETTSVVTEAGPGKSFAWAVGDPEHAAASWRYELVPDGAGTVVRYRAVMGPGPSGLTAAIGERPQLEERIIAGRLGEHERNMAATLAAVKAAAEQV